MNTNQILGLMLTSMVCGGPLHAQSSGHEFVPFKQFLEHTQTVKSYNLIRPGTSMQQVTAIEEMRQHILSRYEGIEVTHSFVLGSSHFDCVPTLQQPSAREFGLDRTASEPPQALLARPAADNDPAAEGPTYPASLVDREKASDEFGNSTRCEADTIPMRRITVEDLAQFSTLREFFQKGPDGAGRALQPVSIATPAAQDLSSHRYSRMYQTVDNLGGNSNLNIWSPYVDMARGEEFTLSQEWYLGGSGDSLQTVEVGWQNYPRFNGDQNSRLFIYWTADNYNATGCYNLDCPAFVQTDSSVTLGADFGSSYSTLGGAQYDFSAQFLLYDGNWWLAIQGKWVGYYPGAIYRGGQLSKYAQQIQFGTESLGTTVWPGEGSGEWSTKGWSQSAYQRNLFYVNTDGKPTWDTLLQWNSSPKCYSVSGPFSSKSSGWDVFFYEGGPGGSGCQ